MPEAATRSVLLKKLFLNISQNSQENTLFFNKKSFPVNFAKYLRTPFLQNTSGRLLLKRQWLNCKVNDFYYKRRFFVRQTENLQQHKSRFSLIVLAFCSSSNLVREVKNVSEFSPNLGGLFRDSFWGLCGWGVKLPPPPLELARIMLETWNLVRKYTTHICSFR